MKAHYKSVLILPAGVFIGAGGGWLVRAQASHGLRRATILGDEGISR